MREYDLKIGGISRQRFRELRAFCLQYPEKKQKARALLGIQGGSRTEEYLNRKGQAEGAAMPGRKGAVSDPVAAAAEKRERLLRDIDLIERCAGAVAGGAYKKAIIQNCCYGRPFDLLPVTSLPSSRRNGFYRARRAFYALLDEQKNI